MSRFVVPAQRLAAGLCALVVVLPGAATAKPRQPSIVVAVIVDQFSAWQAHQRLPLLPATGGFARLRQQGTWFRDVRYPFATTETACGHPALFTGKEPRQTRVVSNDVPEICPANAKDCVAGQPVRDADGTTQMASQVHIGTATPGRAGDRMALDLQPLSGPGGTPNPDAALVGDSLPAHWQRVALSCKDRGAGFATGHRADAMLWWSASKRQMVSPNGQIPVWASDLVTPLSQAKPLLWTALDPAFLARHAGADQTAGEAAGAGATAGVVLPAYGQTLPKDIQQNLGQDGKDLRGYSFRTSPYCDASVLQLAHRALQHYRPNKNSPPLFLGLSLSSNDYIGHAYGPHSHESWDNLLRLDQQLAALFAELDRRAGPDGWALALTADHGVVPLPETPDPQRYLVQGPGGGTLWQLPPAPAVAGGHRLSQGAFQRAAEVAAVQALHPWFANHPRRDVSPLVTGVGAPFVFLGPALRGEGPDALPPAESDRVVAAIAKALLDLPGTLAVYDTLQPQGYGLRNGQCPPLVEPPLEAPAITRADDPLLQALVCRTITPELETPQQRRLYIVTHQGYFFGTDDTPGAGVNHGTPHLYDRSVPLLVRGVGAAKGRVMAEAMGTQLFVEWLSRWAR